MIRIDHNKKLDRDTAPKVEFGSCAPRARIACEGWRITEALAVLPDTSATIDGEAVVRGRLRPRAPSARHAKRRADRIRASFSTKPGLGARRKGSRSFLQCGSLLLARLRRMPQRSKPPAVGGRADPVRDDWPRPAVPAFPAVASLHCRSTRGGRRAKEHLRRARAGQCRGADHSLRTHRNSMLNSWSTRNVATQSS